jgi:hypothetical protein
MNRDAAKAVIRHEVIGMLEDMSHIWGDAATSTICTLELAPSPEYSRADLLQGLEGLAADLREQAGMEKP